MPSFVSYAVDEVLFEGAQVGNAWVLGQLLALVGVLAGIATFFASMVLHLHCCLSRTHALLKRVTKTIGWQLFVLHVLAARSLLPCAAPCTCASASRA